MNFLEAIKIVKYSLAEQAVTIDEDKYDGLIVKILQSSNTLDLGRSTNQTHIAITGNQMDMFPSIHTTSYHESENPDGAMKKYFIGKVDVFISKKNLMYLEHEDQSISTDDGDDLIESTTSVVRNVRRSQADQIQLSLVAYDGEDFINFRKKLHQGYALIILKRFESLEYEAYGIKSNSPHIEELKKLNNRFYYKETNTLVNMSKISENGIAKKPRKKGGQNILLYGVPGSGKSYTINQEYCSDESRIERIVFHPDYMNTDFVGQILPTIKEDKTITYEFTPGPFTRIMGKAYNDSTNMYYLIIEEINRGNAPAIFGDIFQLLDRDSLGNSSYAIKNYNIADIVYNDAEHPVSIPSNLTILATMNTADQNVFTLDTAFQRRWIMRLIKNDVSKAKHANMEILQTGVTWRVFNETINEFILSSNAATMSSEDKRLGAYFITEEVLKEQEEPVFAEKVIKYLWDDAFKFARTKLFRAEYRSLEKVIDDFNAEKGFNKFKIFNDEVSSLLKSRAQIDTNERSENNETVDGEGESVE